MPSPSPLFTPYSSWHSLLSIYPLFKMSSPSPLFTSVPLFKVPSPLLSPYPLFKAPSPPLSLSPLQASFPLPSLYPYSRCFSPPLYFTPYSRYLSPALSLPPVQGAFSLLLPFSSCLYSCKLSANFLLEFITGCIINFVISKCRRYKCSVTQILLNIDHR